MSEPQTSAIERLAVEACTCFDHQCRSCAAVAKYRDAIEQEAVTGVLDALAGDIHRLGSHEGRFESCGGYGCLSERVADYDAVLALIEQHRPKGGPG